MSDFRANDQSLSGNGLSIRQAKSFIESADLSPVIDRLIQIEGWSEKSALAATQLYRNFLYLKKKYGDEHILPPSYEIDEVWHAHILHTRQYVDFCSTLFGGFLHHRPHLAEEASSQMELEKLFETTQQLHCEEFGDYIYAIKKKSIIDTLSQLAPKTLRSSSLNDKTQKEVLS